MDVVEALRPRTRIRRCGASWPSARVGCHTLSTPAQPRQRWWLAIPETCPPGEGTFWLGIVLRLLM